MYRGMHAAVHTPVSARAFIGTTALYHKPQISWDLSSVPEIFRPSVFVFERPQGTSFGFRAAYSQKFLSWCNHCVGLNRQLGCDDWLMWSKYFDSGSARFGLTAICYAVNCYLVRVTKSKKLSITSSFPSDWTLNFPVVKSCTMALYPVTANGGRLSGNNSLKLTCSFSLSRA